VRRESERERERKRRKERYTMFSRSREANSEPATAEKPTKRI
jgi:hypothetical protein